MTAVHEIVIAIQWLNGVLAGDSTLAGLAPGGVWRALAPPLDGNGNPLATPYVIFGTQSVGNDTLTFNAYRLLSRPLYMVKATGPANNMQAIASAANEIDALLKRTAGTVVGGFVGACYRESPLHVDSLVNGELWSDIGGLYRFEVQQTS